jgi:hypothetical protein
MDFKETQRNIAAQDRAVPAPQNCKNFCEYGNELSGTRILRKSMLLAVS